MGDYARLSQSDAYDLIEEHTCVLDIRDPASFEAGHIRGAIHLDNSNIIDVLQNQSPVEPIVVCCYHGHSSQAAAEQIASLGFKAVYSLDGGYAAWASNYPDECEPD